MVSWGCTYSMEAHTRKIQIMSPCQSQYVPITTITVIGPNGEPVEIQIRYGKCIEQQNTVLQHWKYKAGKSSTDDFDRKLTWLRHLMEAQGDLKDSHEFMETLK